MASYNKAIASLEWKSHTDSMCLRFRDLWEGILYCTIHGCLVSARRLKQSLFGVAVFHMRIYISLEPDISAGAPSFPRVMTTFFPTGVSRL